MIASLVARVSRENSIAEVAERLALRCEFEIGDPVDASLLPIVIEASDKDQLNDLTNWLYAQPGIEWADVVYVNWEPVNWEPVSSKASSVESTEISDC